eukprot:GHVP01017921.1.p1 GENE.GHVP01017921.1~~GHVP01017921.1.p1  ORF type:complete len:153 (-),score=5.92 GHVP01017921.1:274-687(-)
MDIVLKEYEVGEGKCSLTRAGAEYSNASWTYRFKGYKRKDNCTKLHYPHLIVMNSDEGCQRGSIFFFFKDPNIRIEYAGLYAGMVNCHPDVVFSTSFSLNSEQDRELTKVIRNPYPTFRKSDLEFAVRFFDVVDFRG